MTAIDWTLFDLQEKEILRINEDLHELRKLKYPEYLDSYYKYYEDFGMLGMVGDLYRKFDRLKNMAKIFSDQDIRDKKKEIKDQYYDLISYMQLQLYFLEMEFWTEDLDKKTDEKDVSSTKTTTAGGFVKDGKYYKISSQVVNPSKEGCVFISCKDNDDSSENNVHSDKGYCSNVFSSINISPEEFNVMVRDLVRECIYENMGRLR